MATGTPTRITPVISNLCRQVVPGGEPIYLAVQATPEAIVNECFENVGWKVQRDGGSIQYGWRIWEWPTVLVEAEFHAVWRSPGGDYVDVSPAPGTINRILFLPDPVRLYEGTQVDNVRVALSDGPLIEEYIRVNEKIFAEMNRGELAYQHGQVSVPAKLLNTLWRRKMELQQMITPAKTGRNHPCPCGSGQKYKKCCGGK